MYKEFIKKTLEENRPVDYIEIGESNNFMRVSNSTYTLKYFGKGKTKVIKHFFIHQRIFKMKFDKYFADVVAFLFKQGVLVSLDSHGNEIIRYRAECDFDISKWKATR